MTTAAPRHPRGVGTVSRRFYRALMRIRPALLASFVKRSLGIRRIALDTAHGLFSVDPVSILGQALLNHGVHEPEMVATFARHLGPGAKLVDLGANEGYFSVVGSRLVGTAGRVIAIEPQTRLQAAFRENMRLNDCTNVRLLKVAVADRRDVAVMYLAADTNSGSSGLNKIAKYGLPMQDVEIRTLADILDQEMPGRIDFMKVDIEGGEYEAILGSPDVFRQHRVRVLALELHPRQLAARGKDADELVRFMRACSYTSDPDAPSVWIAPQGQ